LEVQGNSILQNLLDGVNKLAPGENSQHVTVNNQDTLERWYSTSEKIIERTEHLVQERDEALALAAKLQMELDSVKVLACATNRRKSCGYYDADEEIAAFVDELFSYRRGGGRKSDCLSENYLFIAMFAGTGS
jgi:hypothetical protein